MLCLHTQSTPVHLHSPPRAFLCTYFPSVPVQFLRGFVFLELQCSSSLPSVRTVLIGFFLPFLLQLLNPPAPIQSQMFRAMEGVLFHSSGCWRSSFPRGGVGCSKDRLAEKRFLVNCLDMQQDSVPVVACFFCTPSRPPVLGVSLRSSVGEVVPRP